MTDGRGHAAAPTMPRVSIIIPLYNLRRYVAEAIESVLAQTLDPAAVEIIVVDDGSTDGGGEILRRYEPRIRHLRQPNQGLAAARNAGLRGARAPFLTFLDADDRILPEKLATQLSSFAAHPEADLVHTGWYCIDESGRRLPQRGRCPHRGDVLPELVLGNLLHPHVPMVRRERVEAAGGFDETLGTAADWDLWLRLSQAGARWIGVDRALAEYRIRPDGMHQDTHRMLGERLRILARVFATPGLPPAIAARRERAYQNAYLMTACDCLRCGQRAEAARWFHAAVAARPRFIAEPASLRRFCRLLLPEGHQREQALVAGWRPIARTLRAALEDLYARPDLDPAIRRLRTRARLAYWRTVVRLARKRLLSA